MIIRDYVRDQFVTASQDCDGYRAIHPITLMDVGQFDTEKEAIDAVMRLDLNPERAHNQ